MKTDNLRSFTKVTKRKVWTAGQDGLKVVTGLQVIVNLIAS